MDPRDDLLGYAPFARHLATSISKMIPPEGLVIAIYGPWGSGKTTVLNFIAYYLNQEPGNDRPVVVQFNPWWFSSHEDLTKQFFRQLQAVLSEKKLLTNDILRKLATYADAIGEAPLPYVGAGKAVGAALRAMQRNTAELKASLADELRKQGRQILVIIDDIDRLTAEEVRQTFRAVKAVGDLPNVVYVLAFDKRVVIRAIEQAQGQAGEAYLEKIVQVPFELPLPDRGMLRRLLFEKLDAVLADPPVDPFDKTYWGNIYWEGIDHFIATPRDVLRLANTLSVTFGSPDVRTEVNPVDFIAIEALRVFCPEVYDVIRGNPEAFAGRSDADDGQTARDRLKAFHDSWLSRVREEDREPIQRMVMRMFPKLQRVWGNTYYGVDWESAWRREFRICSPDRFPVYFRLAIPEGSISNTEMQAILGGASDAEAFAKKLVDLANQKRPDGTTRVRAFLERLEDYTQEQIPVGCIPSVLQALFDVGDKLVRPEDKLPGILEFGNDTRIGRVIWQLIRRLDEPSRFEALRTAALDGGAVSTIVSEVATLGQQQGEYGASQPDPEDQWLISAQHLRDLKGIGLQKIRAVAQQGSLLDAPNLPGILHRWRDWAGGDEEVRRWVEGALGTDEGLAKLLEGFLQRTVSQSLSDSVGRVGDRLDPRWLEPFLEPSEIVDRAEHLATSGNLTDRQKAAVAQFIREYEIRKRGEDPDEPRHWGVER